jgi:hypothetical protein
MHKGLVLSFLIILTIGIKGRAQEENFISISVYNFTLYIEWPMDDASSDFIIDVIGHKSVYEKLKEITAGRTVGKRNIVVRFLESVNNITQCQILFLGYWQSPDLTKALNKLGNAHTLVISEKDGLIEAGTGINFIIRDNTIKFEIKKANIQKCGLQVGAELEKMAYKAY